MMLVLDGPSFVAAVIVGLHERVTHAAPMLKYMRGWKLTRVEDYAKRRGWKITRVQTPDDDK